MELLKLNHEFFKKLDKKKIEMNWNKNPIRMDLFKSFLTVEVEKSTDHLGYCNGWTKYFNKENKLEICGGRAREDGVEYLNYIKYKDKLQNDYNNFVSPFYIFEFLNNDGKQFFIDYYKDDIDKLLDSYKQKWNHLEQQAVSAEILYCECKEQVFMLKNLHRLSDTFDYQVLFKNEGKIISVKRMSDGSVFTKGEVFINQFGNPTKILSIERVSNTVDFQYIGGNSCTIKDAKPQTNTNLPS